MDLWLGPLEEMSGTWNHLILTPDEQIPVHSYEGGFGPSRREASPLKPGTSFVFVFFKEKTTCWLINLGSTLSGFPT